MALILVAPLTADKTRVSLPATITFSAAVQDMAATVEAPINHTLQLRIEGGNDLSFGQGRKSAPCTTAVGPRSTPISLTLTISGTGAGLLSFKVTLRDANGELDSCAIDLIRPR